MNGPPTKFMIGISSLLMLASLAPAAGALAPGAPLSGTAFTTTLRERPEIPGQIETISGPFDLPATVEQGFVVLLENPSGPSDDPHNWSDVVDFWTHQAARQAFLISDPQEQGISDADLAPLGLTINQILTGNTVYVPERSPTIYQAADPAGVAAQYVIYSDIALTTLDPADVDWVTTTGGTVRFHLRFRNMDPENTSEPIAGDIMSQPFGVFQPDFGSIGQFNVPALAPNSFFDVFIEIALDQLPPAPQKIEPGMGMMVASRRAASPGVATTGCPPDDHWDGNVDIHWTGASGGGVVTKHIASMLVCPGGGNSYVHTTVLCSVPAGASWTISGVCPGWSATLVNEGPPMVPDGPAPNPVPPGWMGFICVSAGAVVPPGAICPIQVTFDCDGVPATIDLQPLACECPPVLPPGTPLGGTGFTVDIQENPDEPPPGQGEPISGPFDLPAPVGQGFVVLVERAGVPSNDPLNWSDVVDFRTHQTAQQAFMISDPQEQGITDADLAPLGLSIAQILNGNTVYVLEQFPVTQYQATDPTTGLTGTYNIVSDTQQDVGAPNSTGSVSFGIRAASPNPTRGSIRIDYGLTRSGSVRIEIYDLGGKLVRTVRDGTSEAGIKSVQWDGRNGNGARVAAGTYFVLLKAEGKRAAHRVVLLH